MYNAMGRNYPVLELLTQRPRGVGKVFFVDNGGSDSNEGTDPEYPLLLMTTAISKCNSSDKGDTIVVMQESPGSPTTGETWPLVIDKPGILLTGLYSRGLISDSGFGSNDINENTININANFVTIENLYLQVKTGGTTGVVISTSLAAGSGIYGFTIRNCWVGLQYTALYWIYSGGSIDWPYFLVEDNIFGAPNADNATIGIYMFNATFSMVRRNVFYRTSGVTISLPSTCGNMSILDNKFLMTAETEGLAITCAAGSANNFIDGNHANYGNVSNTASSYIDDSTADNNTWGCNYVGKTATDPGTTGG